MFKQRWPKSWRWQLLFAAAGAMALGVQTYLLREFLVLMQGDEGALGVGLGAWFTGIAAGAAATRRCSVGSARFIATGALVTLGILGFVGMLVARVGRTLLGIESGALLSLGPALVMAAAIFALPGACVGSGFVALASVARPDLNHTNGTIGSLYVFEALGSLVAGLGTSLVLFVHVAPFAGMGLLIGLSLLATFPAASRHSIAGKAILVMAAVWGFAVAITPIGAELERKTERLRFAAFVQGVPWIASKHTPYQHLAVGGSDPHVLFANGQYVTSFPDPNSDEVLAHEVMLFAQRPARVLSLGGLETGRLRFCLCHPIEHIDIAQLDADAWHWIERYLDPLDRAALADPRVHVVFDDARRMLTQNGPQYDLVLALEPDPTTLFLSRMTSAEFYCLVRSRLAEDGVFVMRLSAGADLQSAETGLLGASIYRTLRSVFASVRATPGPDALLVAGQSRDTTALDADLLQRRFVQRGIRSDVFLPELLVELLPRERVASINAELARGSRSVAVAHDDRPTTFLHAFGLRQRIARSSWATLLGWSARRPRTMGLMILLPSAILLLGSRIRSSSAPMRLAATHATAIAGAGGLISSLLVFVSFQTRVGALHSELGLLSGLFMLGLAAGGAVAARGQPLQPLLRAQGIGLALGLLLVGALVWLNQHPMELWQLWVAHVSLLAAAGFGTGMVFPAASRELCALMLGDSNQARAGRIAARLEFWDHAGAALAALVAAVLLIPNLGLIRVAALLVALEILGLLLTFLSCGFNSKGLGWRAHNHYTGPP